MQSKHNNQLVPLAKRLRKEMTKEERHLWYDFLCLIYFVVNLEIWASPSL